jgi:SAM-dependent methyltransferase
MHFKEEKMFKDEIKTMVKENYGRKAKKEQSCCVTVKSCCGSTDMNEYVSQQIGYSEEDIKSIPEGANLGLGCGNPVALASLKSGETVLDLGAGAGFDCFLAANQVGRTGRVIGVDMTTEMVEKARENAKKGKYDNVEFRLGDIEALPVEDDSVDVVISNCVINLTPNKYKTFKEAHRVLKIGGRIMISDIVLLKELPDFIKNSPEAYVACVAGASLKKDYMATIKEAGFQEIEIIDETSFPLDCIGNDPLIQPVLENWGVTAEQINEAVNSVVSIKVSAIK